LVVDEKDRTVLVILYMAQHLLDLARSDGHDHLADKLDGVVQQARAMLLDHGVSDDLLSQSDEEEE
jgi:hypothetical protein